MTMQTVHRRMIRKVIRPFKIDKVMEGEGEEGGGGALDETQVKKIILQFEKRALKNQVQTLQNSFKKKTQSILSMSNPPIFLPTCPFIYRYGVSL